MYDARCEQVHELSIGDVGLGVVRVWCVGRMLPEAWVLLGVYTDEQRAVDRCESEADFVAPAFLNRGVPLRGGTTWQDAYRPFGQGCDA